MQSQPLIEKHSAIFHYQQQAINFHYWTHTDAGSTIDTVLFLGTGQLGRIPQWVATSVLPGVAVVEGLPHWKAHPSGKDLKDFSRAYTLCAFQTILADHHIEAAHIIALSQAAPGALWMAVTMPTKIRNISLVEPLGLTKHVFGETEADRVRILKIRAIRSMLQLKQSPLYSPRNLYILLMLIRVRLRETERGAADRKYAEGLSHDLLVECRQIITQQAGRRTRFFVFLGARDVIFPYEEVSAAVNKADLKHIELITIPNLSHTSFTSRHDREALRYIVSTTHNP